MLCLLLVAPSAALGGDPREEGEALRAELAKGRRPDLAGDVRLRAYVGGSRTMGTLVLKTVLVERDGEPIYRLTDRMNLDLPGLGSARLRVEADVRSDFSAVRVVLETEEPRGGILSNQTVTLVREDQKWLRTVTRNHGAPSTEEVDLPERVIVLTPPVGVGERLARLVPETVGRRYKLPAYDLETGLRTSWQLTVDEGVSLQRERAPAVPGLRIFRREGAARLVVSRPTAVGSAPWRLAREGQGHLIVFEAPGLVRPRQPVQGRPVDIVLALLRSAARGDRVTVRACLDVSALYQAAGGDPSDAKLRADFEALLLERLTDPDWLEARGLLLVANATRPDAFEVKTDGDRAARVSPRGSNLAFTLVKTGQGWKVVRLPTKE